MCPSVRASGWYSSRWTQGHLVRLHPSASCCARVPLWEGRSVVVLEVHGALRWQDVSMQHMAMISRFCEQRFLREVDDLVCADVDMKFHDHVGVEILSPLCHPVPQFLLGGQ